MFTLSEQSLELCKNLDQPLTLYHIVETGAEDDRIVSLLDRYAAAGDITVRQIDPVLYPAFTTKYTTDPVANGSVIVEYGDRTKVVDNIKILIPIIKDQNYYMMTGQPDGGWEFDGEGAITSAIHYVTTDDLPVIYTHLGQRSGSTGTCQTCTYNDYVELELILGVNQTLVSLIVGPFFSNRSLGDS